MRVKTATGDIALRGGEDIGASTISGTIDARGGEAERVKLESTTGDDPLRARPRARRVGGDGDAQRRDRRAARRARRSRTWTRRR
jgi:hypothetical protein